MFVHGSPDGSRDWDDLLANAGRFSRAVSFDVSGYGKSDKGAAQIHTTDGVAAYIQGLLDALGIKRAALVVHDFGGNWGLQWATQHREALRGVVLIDGGVLIDYVPHPAAIEFATPGVGEQTMARTTRDTFRSEIQQANPRLPTAYLDRLYDDYDRASRCAILRYYRSASENFQTLGRDQAAALRPLDRPALVLWGGKDPYVPVEQAEKQREAFPSARVEVFEEAGHWPHIEEAERTRGVVIPFLRPRLAVGRPRVGSRGLRIRVPVRADGVLPAQRLKLCLFRGSRRVAPVRRVSKASGARQVTIRLRRSLEPGRYRLTVRARGLGTRRVSLLMRR